MPSIDVTRSDAQWKGPGPPFQLSSANGRNLATPASRLLLVRRQSPDNSEWPTEGALSRRRKTSPADALLELVALMPWWVGVMLAIASYGLLHYWAGQPVTATVQTGQLGSMVSQTLGRTLASFGQYILPLICLIGAGISAWRRRERRQLVAQVVQSPAADLLDGMHWHQFEKLVGEGFRLQGYQVAETGGGGAVGGVDLVLTKGSEKFLVQCKQWRAFKVGVDVVRELYGVMAARGAAGGFVVTSGRFTADASAFAQGRNIRLLDGTELHALIRRSRSAAAAAPAGAAPGLEPEQRSRVPVPPADHGVPSCPVCSKPMLKRTARRGAGAGGAFWGCTGYPSCRGTRPLG